MKWIIEDWAGNRMFPDRSFATFEDGWDYVCEHLTNEEDWQEIYVVQIDD